MLGLESMVGYAPPSPRTLFQKIWDAHEVCILPNDQRLLYIDRHLINEVTSPQAFSALRKSGRTVRRPDAHLAVADHNVPTADRQLDIAEAESRTQVQTLEQNVAEFNIPYVPLRSIRQGIVHVIGPELGLTLPGMTIVCGDSHTSTHGAFGALAFGIGTSEAEHVLATQTLVQKPAKNMRITIEGQLNRGTSAKDLILAIIAQIGTGGATGHVIEYTGSAVTALDMAGRMTIRNMSIEAGARAGLIAPDETTLSYLKGRPLCPEGAALDELALQWLALRSDAGSIFDRQHSINANDVVPMVTWGTSPETAVPIDGHTPDPTKVADPAQALQIATMFDYMGLHANQSLVGLPIDVVFIGSCTNSRIEDLRVVADVVRGRRKAPAVRALIVPGSGLVKQQAEQEGLADIFLAAGFEWREAGCSMCLGMNPDRLRPGQRCASTSNRNFEGRQGPGGRTHLVSPATAAATALHGALIDPRALA